MICSRPPAGLRQPQAAAGTHRGRSRCSTSRWTGTGAPGTAGPASRERAGPGEGRERQHSRESSAGPWPEPPLGPRGSAASTSGLRRPQGAVRAPRRAGTPEGKFPLVPRPFPAPGFFWGFYWGQEEETLSFKRVWEVKGAVKGEGCRWEGLEKLGVFLGGGGGWREGALRDRPGWGGGREGIKEFHFSDCRELNFRPWSSRRAAPNPQNCGNKGISHSGLLELDPGSQF